MPHDPFHVAIEMINAFNDRTLEEKAEQIYAPDFVFTGGMSPEPIQGPAAMAAYNAAFYNDIAPDIKAEVLDKAQDGDVLTFKLRFSGTFTGKMTTPMGEVQGTGQPFSMDANIEATVENDKLKTWTTDAQPAAIMDAFGIQLPQS